MKVCVIPITRQGFRKGERIVQELRMVTERAGDELNGWIDRILEKRPWMLARDGGDGA